MNNDLPQTSAHILAVQAYQPGKPIETLARESGLAVSQIIKLASNESPLGPSPQALAVAEQMLRSIARYPDGASFQLLNTLAQAIGVEGSCLTLGNGSNEVLDLLARAYVQPGDEVWFDQYSFAVYPIVTQLAGGKGVAIPAHQYGHNLQAYLQRLQQHAPPRMIFLANPNNPTGTIFSSQSLKALLDALPVSTLVVLDEAYREYVQFNDYPDGLALLANYPNLVVSRTFSKAYGLAGLRLGYAVASAQITQILQRVRQPFNVNLIAQQAAVAAIEDHAHLSQAIELNRQQLQFMRAQCQQRGVAFIDSHANFLTLDCRQAARPIYEALLKKGIIVRPIADYGLPQHLRISIGLPAENQRFWEEWDGICAH